MSRERMTRICGLFLLATLVCHGGERTPANPVGAITKEFKTHTVVLLGGTDGSVPEHRLLLQLVRSPQFSKTVNAIATPCNSMYQPMVDRYLAGGSVPIDQLQQAWRNSLTIGPVADQPEEELFAAVRDVNERLPVKRKRLRIVCTDGPVDWSKVHSRADLNPFVPTRDEISVRILKEQILAKHQKALVSTGAMHFRRVAGKPSAIEQALQAAGATTYVVLVGSNVTGPEDQQDSRFLRWKWPWMLSAEGTWLGPLPAKPLIMGSNLSRAHIAGPISEAADAFLFIGPPGTIQTYVPKRSALEGTAYGEEAKRRLRVIFGEGRKLPDYLPKDDSGLAPKYPGATKK